MIDFNLVSDSLPFLLRGALVTLQIAGLGCLFGITFGTFLGLLHSGKNKIICWLITMYVILIRGTPMLMHIMFAYYVLPQLGIELPVFWAAIAAISLNSAAYVSQIIKSGISAVSSGQKEAAKTLGFSSAQIAWYIVLPQAFRIVLPALGNEFITLIKDSSLASIIGVAELMREGSIIKSRTFDAISIYCAVALIYLVMTTTLSIFINQLEKRMNRHVKN